MIKILVLYANMLLCCLGLCLLLLSSYGWDESLDTKFLGSLMALVSGVTCFWIIGRKS